MKYRLLEIGRAARSKGDTGKERLEQGYETLLAATGRVLGRAKRFAREIETGVKTTGDVVKHTALERLRTVLDTMVPRVTEVMQQTRARIGGGDTHVTHKVVHLFEPATEVIRKGKPRKPTEFGMMVTIQEAETR